MPHTAPPELSTSRATSLYVGALLGPSLLLLPGLAAAMAGPASILAWAGLLVVSGLLARIFTAFGTRTGGGVTAYAAAGLGVRAGRATGWCFLAGVVLGAPVVCLIGGTYIAAALGGDHTMAVIAAAVLLIAVVALTLGGARTSTAAQLGLVAVLVVLVVVAVTGSAPAARAANWTPFAPHGWASLGSAASTLMLSFVGWEAVAPLTGRLRAPARQLPAIITAAFAVTTVIYLALATTTIAVLGGRAGTAVPLADLLRIALGGAGPVIAAVAAVALTLAATNAYLTGAAELLAGLREDHRSSGRGRTPLPSPARAAGSGLHEDRRTDGRAPLLQLGVAAAGVVLLVAEQAGVITVERLVALPATLFLTIYLACTASAVRVFRGRVRAAAVVATGAVVIVLAFSGWALLAALAVVLAAIARRGSVRKERHGHAGVVPEEGGTCDGGGAVPVADVVERGVQCGGPVERERELHGAVVLQAGEGEADQRDAALVGDRPDCGEQLAGEHEDRGCLGGGLR